MSPTSYQAAPPRSNGTHLSGARRGESRERGVGRPHVRRARCVARRTHADYAGPPRPGPHPSDTARPPIPARRFVLIRCRPAVLWALLAVCALVVRAPEARAAAEVHKLNLLLSSNPSSLALDDLNSSITSYNNAVLDPHGLEGLDHITFAWINEAELRYFVTPNIAVGA